MTDNKTKAGLQYKSYFSEDALKLIAKMAGTFLRLQDERYTVDYNHAIDYQIDDVENSPLQSRRIHCDGRTIGAKS